MESPQKPRRRRSGLLALLMAGTALIAATGATMSLALFTSQVAVAGNAFTAGTIVLGVNPASAILTSGALMPGDVIPVGVPGQVVTVSNTGTGALRYSITGTSTDADAKHLNTVLVLTVRQPDGNAGASCALFTGNVLFSAVVPTAGVNMVGDPTQGNQAGESRRAEDLADLGLDVSLMLEKPGGKRGAGRQMLSRGRETEDFQRRRRE